MISIGLRILLIVGSLATFIYLLTRIRKSQIKIEDSIFWIVMPIVLVIISIFPGIAEWAAKVIGIIAPVNFVFLAIIFILIIKVFSLSIRLSQTENKLQTLIQEFSIKNYERRNKNGKT
jgi:hypothetical protein